MIPQDTERQGFLPLPENDDVLIRRSDLSDYLPISPQTAARWAHERQGPSFIRIGKRIVAYRSGDLKKWLQESQNGGAI